MKRKNTFRLQVYKVNEVEPKIDESCDVLVHSATFYETTFVVIETPDGKTYEVNASDLRKAIDNCTNV